MKLFKKFHSQDCLLLIFTQWKSKLEGKLWSILHYSPFTHSSIPPLWPQSDQSRLLGSKCPLIFFIFYIFHIVTWTLLPRVKWSHGLIFFGPGSQPPVSEARTPIIDPRVTCPNQLLNCICHNNNNNKAWINFHTPTLVSPVNKQKLNMQYQTGPLLPHGWYSVLQLGLSLTEL